MRRRRLAAELGAALTNLSLLLRQGLLPPGINMAQARTLLSLRDCGPQRITDLAQLERVRQPTMSALIARMEEFGWVARVAGEADRRAVFVRLTDEGKSIIDEAEAARNAALNSYLGALSGDDLAALTAALPPLHRLIEQAQRASR
ncbi:MAG TPA: MarR family transcriptional regulator [Actinomycetota bacterium]|nr:MarR family transcriptional regulator [Actinomycetota bacterium]